jgi:HK97 family phage major capsid protein
MDRAYALLEIKTVDAARRRFSGIASTPELDRQGDQVDPAGLTWRNPIPLLLHHNQSKPVGTATLSRLPDGRIAFDGEIVTIAEAGTLRDRVDEAWQSIKAGLIRGTSIGHQIAADGITWLKGGARRVTASEVCELSLVTIPANVHATILSVKSLATPARKAAIMKLTTAEHIQNLENKRAAIAARMSELLQTAADEGRTTNEDESAEHDRLTLEIKSLDADLGRWREHERLNVSAAAPIPPTPAPMLRGAPRPAGLPVISVKSNVPIGTAFVRLACAKLVCNGNLHEAAEYAQRWNDSTPEVALALKAAIAPGTTTDATWAGPLVSQNISKEFIELLRPATIIGKIPGFRMVPFNTKVPAQSGGGTYGWVGEAKPKPVTKLAFTSANLGYTKAAGIIVLTEELVRLSTPSAEDLARADMIAGIAQFLDAQFIDPAVAAVAGVNPASITNGAPTAAGSASPLADLITLISFFSTANVPISGLSFIMSPANLLALAFRTNSDGSPQFPGLGIEGGNYKGINFVGSTAAGANVIGLQPNLILMADDGQVSVDASREASLQMDSAPASPADATTVYVSLWQTNTVGLRAERWINWQRANANAVKYLTAVAWPAPSGAMAETPAE